jgi:hypothetical protein
MITRSIVRSSRAVAIALALCAGLGATALAQTAKPPGADASGADPSAAKAPSVDQLNSAASLNDTVHDPRIAKSQAGEMGIWKSAVPPVKMKGAFDDNDPMGLAAGKKIPADCSINWTDPDTHKLYCFSSATSLVYFLYAPKTNTARAEKGWRELKGAPTG